MATAAPLIATLAVIEVHPSKGDRARYTIPVRTEDDIDTAAAKAESVRARLAGESGNVVRIDTHKVAA